MVAAMHASTTDSSMEHATAATAVPTASGNMSMHGALPLVPSPPVFTAGHADEQLLFQSAKAIVQHHLGPVMGATMGAPELQTYPPARATHEQVCDDPDLFQETLRELYDALDIKVAKVMKLGGQELNLHLLYQRRVASSASSGRVHILDMAWSRYSSVTDCGGALQVIRDKLWRDVGDAFDLPKTITSLSYVLKRGYMQYLWDYEQVYFHRKSCMPRILPPASKYSKDQQNIPQQTPSSTGGYQVPHPAMHMHAVDAAAAMAVAALRGRSDWSTSAVPHSATPASTAPLVAPQATSTYPQIPTSSATDLSTCTAVVPPSEGAIPPPPGPPEDVKVPHAHLSESSAADPTEPVVKDAVMHDDSTAQHAQHAQHTDPIVAHSMALNAASTAPTGQQQQDSSMMCTLPMPFAHPQLQPLPLAAMLQSQPHTHLSSLVGKRGSFEVVQSAGPHGVLISGSVDGQQFFGVLGGSPGSSSCMNTPVGPYPRTAAADSTTAAGCNLVTAQSGAMCGAGDQGSDFDYELHAAKRTRTCEPRAGTQSSSKAVHASHTHTHDNMDSMMSGQHPNISKFEQRAREAVAYPPRHGPQASPNTHTELLPTNRHMAYPRAPDHLVQPLPMGHGVVSGTETGLGDCMDLPLYQGLGDFGLDDALIGAGELEEMLGLGDDFMLEEPV